MNNSNVRKGIIIGVIICTLVLVGFLGSYAFFINNIANNKNEEVSAQTGTLSLTFSDGNNGFSKALEFGGSAEKTFRVENTGTIKATFSILWMNMLNTYLEGSLTYTLEESDAEDGTYIPLLTDKDVPTEDTRSDKSLMSGIEIEPDTTKFYKLTITLNNLESTDQTSDLSATLDTQFKIVEGIVKEPTQAEKVLAKLGKVSKSSEGLDFALQATTDETADGLFELEDDYGTSYFYRGDVTDNYVKFGKWSETSSQTDKRGKDMYWRIIRVNGDGSVRLLYDGTSAHTNSDASADRAAWSSQVFNVQYDDAKYAGYMFGGEQGSASTKRVNLGEEGYADPSNAIYNQTSSDIKIKLEEWYVENLKVNDDKIADAIYCNDRSMPGKELSGWSVDKGLGYGRNSTAFGCFQRAGVQSINRNKVMPRFTCSEKNDAFTINETEKGNGALSEKIGLISADEAIAGGTGGSGKQTNTSNYLNRGLSYWSSSPFYYANNFDYIFEIGLGNISSRVGYETNNVIPVISLTPEYFNTLIGEGTMESPFRESETV